MSTKGKYDKEYFEGIYAHLKKEKEQVLKSFFDLLSSQLGSGKIEKILDLGCGEGEFLKICQDAGLACFGVDISPYALAKAVKTVKGEFLGADLEKDYLPYPDNFFDAVTAFDLLEHLENPKLVLSEIQRVLKPSGLFFCTTPNGDSWLGRVFGHFVPDDSTHVNLQGADYWRGKLKKAGFSKVKIKGSLLFGLPPYLNFRYFLARKGFPVLIRPIFIPFLSCSFTLFIFAKKI